ncbi:MAG TPA: MarR family transcriptional regulator [Nitrolancea sp.]|nr:MarR family transcriptional regulator [Nitrolancea sp.]
MKTARVVPNDSQPNQQHEANATTIARALDVWISRLGREFGPLSRPQRRALRSLDDLIGSGASVRASDLAEYLGLTSAGTTRMLNKLEASGYVGRFREPDGDQREVYAALTDSGIAALHAANEVYFERVDRDLERLDEKERQTLARLLEKLTAAG